jgi:hypothetical protein
MQSTPTVDSLQQTLAVLTAQSNLLDAQNAFSNARYTQQKSTITGQITATNTQITTLQATLIAPVQS